MPESFMHSRVKTTLTELTTGAFRRWKSRARAGRAGSLIQRAEPSRCAGHTVRLSEPALRQPATRVERLVVSMLKQEGIVAFDLLVARVAHDLYRDTLLNVGWVVDLGLFGSDLFRSEAASELEVGNGLLWQIDTATHAT